MDHWDPLMTDGLAEGREVILYNGRGIASSGGTPRTRIEDMADDAAAFVRALGLKQIDVLGFSLGGFQALDLTWRHPELVRKLMLLGTGPRGGNPEMETARAEHGAPPGAGLRGLPVPVLRPIGAGRAGRARILAAASPARRPGSAVLAGGRQRADRGQHAVSAPAVGRRSLRLPAGIRQPTFILNGVHDVMIPTINSFYMARNLPNAQLFIYPDSGHAAQFQNPQRFLHHAVQFLSE
jgi:pimeloyl-ACP methyl ester carboxylesterase